jgi:hypothetical protein
MVGEKRNKGRPMSPSLQALMRQNCKAYTDDRGVTLLRKSSVETPFQVKYE